MTPIMIIMSRMTSNYLYSQRIVLFGAPEFSPQMTVLVRLQEHPDTDLPVL